MVTLDRFITFPRIWSLGWHPVVDDLLPRVTRSMYRIPMELDLSSCSQMFMARLFCMQLHTARVHSGSCTTLFTVLTPDMGIFCWCWLTSYRFYTSLILSTYADFSPGTYMMMNWQNFTDIHTEGARANFRVGRGPNSDVFLLPITTRLGSWAECQGINTAGSNCCA